jgi:hypothetical protein
MARLKANLPELSTAVEARFGNQPPTVTFQHGEDRIEAWDADDFDSWETLAWPTVRVLRYRQYKPDGTIIQADWLTDFSIARLGARSFFKLAKSRYQLTWGAALAVAAPLLDNPNSQTPPGKRRNRRRLRFSTPAAYPTARRLAERRPPVSVLNFPKPLGHHFHR